MDDMTAFERELSTRLQAHLGPRRPFSAHTIAAAAVAGGNFSRSAATRPWRLAIPVLRPVLRPMPAVAWFVVVSLAMVALLALAFTVGRRSPRPTMDRSPAAVIDASPSPVASHEPGPYVALYLQPQTGGTVNLVASLPDGSERLVRSIPAAVGDSGSTASMYGEISNTGWLALQVTSPDRYAFFDLKDPTSPPWVVSYWGAISGAWSNDGRFAVVASAADTNGSMWNSPGGTDILDPTTRSTTHLGAVGAIGGGPRIYWSADGAGVLSRVANSFGILQADGRSVLVGGIPAIADRDGERPFGHGGAFLCGSFNPGIDGPDCPATQLTTAQLGSQATQWGSLIQGDTTISDASFAFDGRALWATDVSNTPGHAARLLRFAAAGPAPDVVARIGRGALRQQSIAQPEIAFAGLAPDDSVLVLAQTWQDSAGVPQIGMLEVSGDGSSNTLRDGNLAGFARLGDVESWPAGTSTSGSPAIATPSVEPTATPQLPLTPPPVALPALIPIDGPYVPVVTRTSSDGKRVNVVAVGLDGTERVVRGIDASRRSAYPLTVDTGAQGLSAKWGPNGLLAVKSAIFSSILACRQRSSQARRSISASQAALLFKPTSSTYVDFRGIAPDGSAVAFSSWSLATGLVNDKFIYRPADGSASSVHTGASAGWVPASSAATWLTVGR